MDGVTVTTHNTRLSFLLLLWIALVGLLFALGTQAGTLRLGKPTINGNQYTFPVVLQGNAEGVAALDFQLAYDPTVFTPVAADTGHSALQAQKQVSSNVAAPGEFVVVLMGFNQNTVAPGEVVQLVLKKIGTPSNGNTLLRIAEPTLATSVGVEVDSRGSGRRIRFDDPVANQDKETATTKPKEPAKTPQKPSDTRSGETASATPDGPIFIPPADYHVPTKLVAGHPTPKAAKTGSKKASPPSRTVADTSAHTDGGAHKPTVPVEAQRPSNAATTAKTQHSDEYNGRSARKIVTETTPQPIENKDITEHLSKNIAQNNEKGRQEGGKYATLILLALGVPLGLFVVLRVASK